MKVADRTRYILKPGREDGKGIVFLKIEGIINRKSAGEFFSEAVALAAEHECRKFLGDLTGAEVQESTFGILEHVKEMGEIGLKKSDLVAVLAQKDVPAHKFFETAARNRGWYNIRYFKSEKDAIEWLQAE